MLGKNDIYFYKDLYSGHKIIYVRFLGKEFVFKTLTRKEYKFIKLSYENKLDVEEMVCNAACIYPKDTDFSEMNGAGIVTKCAELIEYYSGFSDISTVINEYKKFKQVENMETQCMDVIKAFIPEYTYEEMKDWTWEHLMEITARAERVAKLRGVEIGLKDATEEIAEKIDSISIDNDEFTKELLENGIDPMMYFYDDLKDKFKHDIIDFPLIMGNHWNDERVIKIVSEQINKRRKTNS